ncbi:hypothetical protein ACHAWO_009513 [Cyclotella atomus]|uniref:Uncharacterized protein n=1 Tax=Cyclotella atomus TaxID=382360 RepID=A0ABD3N2U3_9STRA
MKSNARRRSIISIAVACLPLAAALQPQICTRCASRANHPTIPSAAANSIPTTLLYASKNEHLSKRERKQRLEELQKRRRRSRWIKRYGSVSALQQTFGTGPPWGDLSPTQTRALYHTLLPRSLLALNEMGLVQVEDLAPLAYEARIAAKEYARSRCVWTGRVGVFLFDQYRSLRDKGRLIKPGSSSSMSWEEIWAKYETQIIREAREKGRELDEDEIMMQTYMRILERSCATNAMFDNLFLKSGDSAASNARDDIDLESIAMQLERDVRAILLSPRDISKAEKREEKLEKKKEKVREKEEKLQRKEEKKKEKREKKL